MKEIKKFIGRSFAMIAAILMSLQSMLPMGAYAQSISKFEVEVKGNGVATVSNKNNEIFNVDKDNPLSLDVELETELTLKIDQQDGVELSAITLNDTAMYDYDGGNTYEHIFTAGEADSRVVVSFDTNEDDKITLGDKQIEENTVNSDSENKDKNKESSNVEKEETYDLFSQLSIPKDVNLEQGVLPSNSDFKNFSISDIEKKILLDYRNGLKNNDEYLKLRKQIVEKIHAKKYANEEFFVTKSIFKDYADLNVILYSGGVVLIDPDMDYTQSLTRRSRSLSNPSVDYFWNGSYTTIRSGGYSYTWIPGQWHVDGINAYCGQALQSPPQIGHKLNSAFKITNNENLRKAVYYGLQNPGDRILSATGGNIDLAAMVTNELISWAYSGTTLCKQLTGLNFVIDQYGWIYNLPSPPADFVVYGAEDPAYFTGSFGYKKCQTLIFYHWEEQTGGVKIKKSSSNPTITDNNSCYSLAGAEFGLYRSQSDANNDTSRIATLTTQPNGESNIVDKLKPGAYYVKELKAPKGFYKDPNVKGTYINAGQTAVIEFKDLPMSDPIAILIEKRDMDTDSNQPQGSAKLENAEFTVKFYAGYYDSDPAKQGVQAERTWVLRTDEDGYAYLGKKFLVSGDDFYYNGTSVPTLPLGTFTIQETKAPDGYYIHDEVYVKQIKVGSKPDEIEMYNRPVVQEQVMKLHVKKIQVGTDVVIPDAKFLHTKPDGTTEFLNTDSQGYIHIVGLENGRHSLQEVSVMDGYEINPTRVEFDVISGQGVQMVSDLTNTGISMDEEDKDITLTVSDEVSLFDLKIVKTNDVDKLLDGAEFTLYEDADCTRALDKQVSKNGILTFKNLKDRTHYYVKETKAPKGYRIPLDSETKKVHVFDIYTESTPVHDSFKMTVDGQTYTERTSVSNPVHMEGTKKHRVMSMNVINQRGMKLPKTGSSMTLLFTLMGNLVMATSIIGYRRRKEN